jgi:tetratricopeptide (TPR) repeat protein
MTQTPTRLLATIALAAATTAACSARAPKPTTPAPPQPEPQAERDLPHYQGEPIHLQARRDPGGEISYEVRDARTHLLRGNAAMAEQRHDDALGHYRSLVEEFPGSSLTVAALYNMGLAYEAKGDPDHAVDSYRRLLAAHPEGPDSVDAHMRIGAVLADAGRFAESAAALEQLMARRDLSKHNQVEGWARLGYARLEGGDPAAAAEVLDRAVDEWQVLRKYGDNDADDDYYAAMAHYYEAQIAHRQFLDHPIRPERDRRLADIEARGALLRKANDRYADAMRIGQPYWATAAVYQISEIYKQMWDALVTAPPPADLAGEQLEVYRKELHAESRQLLETALTLHSKSVEMARLYQVDNRWSRASAARVAELGRILAAEATGQLHTPTPGPPLHAGPTAELEQRLGPDEYVPARADL